MKYRTVLEEYKLEGGGENNGWPLKKYFSQYF